VNIVNPFVNLVISVSCGSMYVRLPARRSGRCLASAGQFDTLVHILGDGVDVGLVEAVSLRLRSCETTDLILNTTHSVVKFGELSHYILLHIF
jgi:hypothetical protein